jgi:transposase
MRAETGKLVDVDRAVEDVARALDEHGKSEALALVRAMLETMARTNARLEIDRMRLLKKHLGQTSERMHDEQLQLLLSLLPEEERPANALVPAVDVAPIEAAPTASDEESTSTPSSTKKKKGRDPHGRKPLPDSLRRVEVPPHEVPAAERVCATCGKDKICIGHDRDEVLCYRPAELFVEVHTKEKLACPGECTGAVSVAAGPDKVIEKGRPDASMLAKISIGKYEDYEPLHRQKKLYERLGYSPPVSTMVDWVAATTTALEPIEKLIKKLVLEGYLLQGDDTGLKVLDEKAPGGAKRGHLWFYVADATLCAVVYTPDWSKESAGLFLHARKGGLFVGDAYKGYDHLFTKTDDPLIECGCWAHARRPFVELAERGEARAAVMLHHVKKLYEVEKLATEARDGPEQRRARRERDSTPIIEAIEKWRDDVRAKEPPKSALAGAVGYLWNQRDALKRFLHDGAIPIDNTLVERTLRGVAQGRKNFLFAGSDAGAMRAATMYTIIATCRLCGVEPLAYVEDVLRKVQTGRWPYARLRELVPDRWRETAPASALVAPKR